MSVLDRKLRRDLFRARSILVAILLVIVVGIACFVGLASAYANLERSRRVYYAECRMADFSIELKKAPRTEAVRAAMIPGVARVQPRIVFEAIIDLDRVPRPLNGRVISLPGERRPGIDDIVMRRGSYFTNQRAAEVIVNDAFARARKIIPGHTIHVILNNRRQALLVVGTAVSSEFVYLLNPGSIVPEPDSYGVLYVKERFAEEVMGFDGACNQLVGLLTPAHADRPEPVLAEIERRLDAYGVFTTTPRADQPSHRILTNEIEGLRVSAAVLPAIFLAVAALILNILMSRLAEQQRTTVGTLKALGYTSRTLVLHYLKFGTAVGLVGGGLGLVAGYGLAYGMTAMYRYYFQLPVLENRIVPEVLVAGVVISVVFATLGTLRGVRAVIRLSPAEAMRPRPPGPAGGVRLERFHAVWRRLGFRGQMVARSVWRHRWRTTVGMFAAAMGSALLFVTFYFVDSLEYLIEFQFDQVMRSDYELVLQENRAEPVVHEAARLPGVIHAEPVLQVPCELHHGRRRKKAAVTGLVPGATLTVPRDARGDPVVIPETGLVLGRKLAEVLDVRAGEVITVRPIRGLRRPVDLTVARIADTFIGISAYGDFGFMNRAIGEVDAVSAVQLKTTRSEADRVALYARLKRLPAVQAIGDRRRTMEAITTMFLDAVWYSVAALVGLAAVIFFGSILTASLIALAERRREVATLLVNGFEPAEVGGIFLRESLLVNMVGAVIGLPLGLWLSVALVEATSTELYRLPVVSSSASSIATLAIAAAFTVLAHALVRRAISRLDWQEALNAKE